jgi:hypothetical protein
VTNGGIIIGSLAVYHDDPTGVARELLPRAIENARTYCSQAVESDGTWKESPDYWLGRCTTFFFLFLFKWRLEI